MAPLLAQPQQALWCVPTPPFQRTHYARRAFVSDILAQCSDPGHLWANWTARDEQFAAYVATDAAARGLAVAWVAGERSLTDLTVLAAAHFGL